MIITASHQKGGVGKSTLIWNLIIEYSKRRKVYVVDLDMQKTITYSLKIREKTKENKNILLLSPKNKDELIKIFKRIKKDDLLFVDSGGFDSSMNRIAMAGSNILLTPVSLKFYELLGLKKYELILKDLSEKLKRDVIADVVLNKINPSTKQLKEIITFVRSSKYFRLMSTVIRQRVDYENSPGQGKSVVEFNKVGKAAIEIKKLQKEIDSTIT